MTKIHIYLIVAIAILLAVVSLLLGTGFSFASTNIQFAGRSWHTYSGTGLLGQKWQPSHVAVKSGVLNIVVSNQIGGGVALPTSNQLYATYKVRFRMSKSAGTKYVILLWPGKGIRPEIDFAEDDHRDNGQRALTTMSWHPDLITSHERHFGIQRDFSNWHTATLIWKPDGLSFMIDSTLVKHITNTSHVPMHLCIQADSWTTQGPPAILQVSSVSITKNS